jgi:hypothetical protein
MSGKTLFKKKDVKHTFMKLHQGSSINTWTSWKFFLEFSVFITLFHGLC